MGVHNVDLALAQITGETEELSESVAIMEAL
jgi:hypothetical protein